MAHFLSLKTVSGKITLICLLSNILLIVLVLSFVLHEMYQGTKNNVQDLLPNIVNYLEMSIQQGSNDSWYIKDNTLYFGNIKFDESTSEEISAKYLAPIENKRGTFVLIGIRRPDEIVPDVSAFSQTPGHYQIVSAGSLLKFNPYALGAFCDKALDKYADQDKEVFYEFPFNGIPVFTYFRPIKDKNGTVIGVISSWKSISQLKIEAFKASQTLLLALVIVISLAFIVIIVVSRRFANKITRLRNHIEKIGSEDSFEKNTNDEIDNIFTYIDEIILSLHKNQRIKSELSVAADIQKNLLPNIFPPFPECPEFDIFATMTPAKEVGGDFYDYFLVDDTKLALVIGDVSGKGIPASLVMLIAKNLIKTQSLYGLEPGNVFTTVNKLLCENNNENMFVTAWMGILDFKTGKLTYTNAGHNPPLIRKQSDHFEYLRSKPGLVLGGMEGIRYHQHELQLAHGDKLLLYTDGITEATNTNLCLYGENRLSEFLNQHQNDPIIDILHNLRKDIDAFTGTAEQFDDMTMLMLHYN